MTVEQLTELFGVCNVAKFGIVMLWFDLSNEQLNVIHYTGMAIYEIGIFLFNLMT